jgi:hypothetical protein
VGVLGVMNCRGTEPVEYNGLLLAAVLDGMFFVAVVLMGLRATVRVGMAACLSPQGTVCRVVAVGICFVEGDDVGGAVWVVLALGLVGAAGGAPFDSACIEGACTAGVCAIELHLGIAGLVGAAAFRSD